MFYRFDVQSQSHKNKTAILKKHFILIFFVCFCMLLYVFYEQPLANFFICFSMGNEVTKKLIKNSSTIDLFIKIFTFSGHIFSHVLYC